jgi:large subunit ribosomal protein L10
MALSIEQKKAVVEEVAEVAKTALAAVAAEYRGITVEEMTDLRVKARESGVYLKVAGTTAPGFQYGRSRCCCAPCQRLCKVE